MPVSFQKQRTKLIAALQGELDHHGAEEMRTEIDRRLRQDKPAVLRLDFRRVTFMDSSGVGLVMGRYRLLRTWGGTLELSGMTGTVLRIMQLSGIDKIAAVLTEKGTKHETRSKHETGN